MALGLKWIGQAPRAGYWWYAYYDRFEAFVPPLTFATTDPPSVIAYTDGLFSTTAPISNPNDPDVFYFIEDDDGTTVIELSGVYGTPESYSAEAGMITDDVANVNAGEFVYSNVWNPYGSGTVLIDFSNTTTITVDSITVKENGTQVEVVLSNPGATSLYVPGDRDNPPTTRPHMDAGWTGYLINTTDVNFSLTDGVHTYQFDANPTSYDIDGNTLTVTLSLYYVYPAGPMSIAQGLSLTVGQEIPMGWVEANHFVLSPVINSDNNTVVNNSTQAQSAPAAVSDLTPVNKFLDDGNMGTYFCKGLT